MKKFNASHSNYVFVFSLLVCNLILGCSKDVAVSNEKDEQTIKTNSVKIKPSYEMVLGGVNRYKDSIFSPQEIADKCEVKEDSFKGTIEINSPIDSGSAGYETDLFLLQAKLENGAIKSAHLYIQFSLDDRGKYCKDHHWQVKEAIDIEKNHLQVVNVSRELDKCYTEDLAIILQEEYLRDRAELGLRIRIYSSAKQSVFRDYEISNGLVKGFLQAIDSHRKVK